MIEKLHLENRLLRQVVQNMQVQEQERKTIDAKDAMRQNEEAMNRTKRIKIWSTPTKMETEAATSSEESKANTVKLKFPTEE